MGIAWGRATDKIRRDNAPPTRLQSFTMKSPFPGMDPYLEQHWEDVHTRLIGYIADALQPQLSEDLIARMEEKVYVEDTDDGEMRLRRPDVRVVEFPSSTPPTAGDASTA